MASSSLFNTNPSFTFNPLFQNHAKIQTLFKSNTPISFNSVNQTNPLKFLKSKTPNCRNPRTTDMVDPVVFYLNKCKKKESERKDGSFSGIQDLLNLCGFGYWIQGFRCFPWLALNFHMANNLNMNPSTLQLVQNSANLPMVAKPLYGILSDALFIGGSHRLPYISIGVVLQILSWGSMALIPIASEALPILMTCVLLSNLGAAITEVAKDALVAEYGQKNKINGLQSYAFMALAAGGVLANCLGGFLLLKTQKLKSMFLIFASLLSFQLALSLKTKEESFCLPRSPNHHESISSSIKEQFSDLITAIKDDCVLKSLSWIVASFSMVPILSGSLFCYQIQILNLDPFIIGMSKVVGQVLLLGVTILYNRYFKTISFRKLIGTVQILYACSLLLDLVLVKQINLKLGIPNNVFVVCISGIAEIINQFKILPFQVLFASLAPAGCEGSLMSFLASALCLSSICSGFLGVGMASCLGITSVDYSNLPVGIGIQFLAALVPVFWIHNVPTSLPSDEKDKKTGLSKKRRKTRRVGRVVFNMVFVYRRERESEAQR
ncbi:putative MFS transporter superfamily, biopterin transporter family [Helianthus annuus]|uniref:Major facilitator superfamily domain, MFS transporter superfamily n=1 Tax=Helianthus annuus TaxID=4232 RepID=A0A251VQP6_HELAN|nr:probable folate-biopterin transporter 8, chloroplastic isoform X1 [Helianthus annuus]KAF5823092.1 putative major facilitator superfamily domain, MFS transporter superfamily [Helianthus annuus]KAJ0627848.1 putative MFS transporter superfamily, biopterin transporter family [Helianthus annuus]KAJ0949131.1 putative MFS transporter superfamily, biopterin transporter family [Helianthus annuus]